MSRPGFLDWPTHAEFGSPPMRSHRSWMNLIFIAAAALSLILVPARGEEDRGLAIYSEKCASCHGAKGEGSADGLARALAGDKTVAQLTKLIVKTMPEDDPGTLSKDDAELVTRYLYDAFYSPVAQARNRVARIELSRLTVRQLQNTLADLVGSFRESAGVDDQRGLAASYYARREPRGKALIERTDPMVKFDFGTQPPADEGFKPHEFSIRWTGSVLATEDGEYDFVVHTDHATRLWVNDMETPLINAWVKSGNDTEFRGSIRLLGGRAYPMRLEFAKSLQGVENEKIAEKLKQVPASVSLGWKLPRRAEELIPERNLTPVQVAETFVPTTPFPPDDRTTGYERGTSISKEWDQAATDAALELVGYVSDRLRNLADTKDDDPERSSKLKAFARTFAERAFRRPLNEEEAGFFIDHPFGAVEDPGTVPEAFDVDGAEVAPVFVSRGGSGGAGWS